MRGIHLRFGRLAASLDLVSSCQSVVSVPFSVYIREVRSRRERVLPREINVQRCFARREFLVDVGQCITGSQAAAVVVSVGVCGRIGITGCEAVVGEVIGEDGGGGKDESEDEGEGSGEVHFEKSLEA